ncbi:MAG: di-trans,poly-cis-decaprenylcistransferase [Candidatus Yanofskybacteria bacterium]|nr:di-trans,poly-cis-decaprenylcistransferase [Candidatus Yanofskybacteria bacterium]
MKSGIPNHIAIIPDGNRRWAKSKGRPSVMGHLEGKKRFHEISKIAFNLGIPYFTFWAMSEDNYRKRCATEIDYLVSLLKKGLNGRLTKDLFEKQIRFKVFGKWKELTATRVLADLIKNLEMRTANFDKHHLTLLLGYDGKQELVEAFQIQAKMRNWQPQNAWQPGELDFQKIKATLWTRELPPVDLVIRTGETKEHWFHNSSGFMMLHTTDSEIYISPTLWPDFSEEEFKKIIEEYGQRERKLGK